MHDYVCVDGCCSISYDDVITLQSESGLNVLIQFFKIMA